METIKKYEPKVTPAKFLATLVWINLIASPFVLALCCTDPIVTCIGIVYGVIIFNACRFWMPKWMRDAANEIFSSDSRYY